MTIKIYDKIEVKKINDVKPYWRNPRKNDKTVEALIKVIPVVGFNVPIYIDNEGVIIKGHARYRSAVRLGMTEIPCIVSTNSEEQNRLDRISDNKVSELAEWDLGELRYELEQIDFNLEDIGFDLPKDDFMDDVYEQEEFNEVSEADFAKARQKIINSTASHNEHVNEAFSNSNYEKSKCPHCGNDVVIFL